ncbi:MAG: 4-hydroxyacetophenone monooxygenase, partial [Candidatus Eremiobacteraeota bacterium]|nr:4-hydroxyacetophenone monooxygenase [Candidatus Eremiobacteraeota bacterium]
ISNDYYPALRRDNVDVVTQDILRFERDGIRTRDGVRHHADVIVYGTGFRAQEGVGSVRIVGAGGHTLEEAWSGGMEAFLGVSVAGFPNFFMLVGPNTGLGHNSMVYMIESQANYVLSALRHLRERKAVALDVRANVQADFNRSLQHRMKRTVWSSGCRSWYLDANGKNTALWPGFTFEFRRRTYRIDPRRYRVRLAADEARSA